METSEHLTHQSNDDALSTAARSAERFTERAVAEGIVAGGLLVGGGEMIPDQPIVALGLIAVGLFSARRAKRTAFGAVNTVQQANWVQDQVEHGGAARQQG